MARAAMRLRTEAGKLNQLGKRVSQRRAELKLEQDALCGRIAAVTKSRWNPSRMEIYRIEIGDRIVSDLETIALAEALDCDAAWLLLGENVAGRRYAP
jgi:transcriptional regulator with XRE-family HTH domain